MTVRHLESRRLRKLHGKPTPPLIAVFFKIDQQACHITMHQWRPEFHRKGLRQTQGPRLPSLGRRHYILGPTENLAIRFRNRASRVLTTKKKCCHAFENRLMEWTVPEFPQQRNLHITQRFKRFPRALASLCASLTAWKITRPHRQFHPILVHAAASGLGFLPSLLSEVSDFSP